MRQHVLPTNACTFSPVAVLQLSLLDVGTNYFTGALPSSWGNLTQVSTSINACSIVPQAMLVPCIDCDTPSNQPCELHQTWFAPLKSSLFPLVEHSVAW